MLESVYPYSACIPPVIGSLFACIPTGMELRKEEESQFNPFLNVNSITVGRMKKL